MVIDLEDTLTKKVVEILATRKITEEEIEKYEKIVKSFKWDNIRELYGYEKKLL